MSSSNTSSNEPLYVDRDTAMRLFDSYKQHGNLTTHQPFPLGAGGVAKFWTENLSFVFHSLELGYLVTVKAGKKQSALVALKKFLGDNK